MEASVKGLVERLQLTAAKAMMPLYEAISNSIDAAAETRRGLHTHQVRIRLLAGEDLAQGEVDGLPVIDGFEITDDGIGFTDANLASFREAHTMSKLQAGGKGVGRFTYLKVFSFVRVRSVFRRGDAKLLRDFDFDVQHEVRDGKGAVPTSEPQETTVSMRGIAKEYRSGWSNDPDVIARRIIAHFLIRFAARSCPPMVLESPGHAPIDLHKVYEQEVQAHIEEQAFIVEGQHFLAQALRNRDGRSRHSLHLCATGREVLSAKLRDLLPELPERFIDDDQQPYTLIVLVTGDYLDRHANQERTKIAFQAADDNDFDETLVTRQALNKGLVETLRPLLVGDLKATHEEKRAQIERFVEEAPEYRVLTHEKYRALLEQHVQPGLKDEQLDEALLHLRRGVEDEMRKEERRVAVLIEKESFEQYQERIRRLMEDMNDVGKAKLADYVAHRRIILDLVDQSLKRVHSDGKYPFERVLHQMIFPMGATSKDVFLDQQNLWLLDERLCFHTLLTSDKKLNKVRGLEGTSGKEPDIFAFFYDTPIGVAEADSSSASGGGVVILEFKRPGRDDYDKDPADQIVQRFDEIAQGGVRDIDGRTINPERLRYTGYLIADLTPSLHRQVRMRYHRMADNEGYFATLPGGNGYIEVISYNKLVSDAKRRNRVLFEKLGLHKN